MYKRQSLAAVILKTGKAKTADKPVLMTIEGTTFYKMKNFQVMFEAFLQGFLSGENRRYYEIVEVPLSLIHISIDEELSNKEFFATLAAYLTSYVDRCV